MSKISNGSSLILNDHNVLNGLCLYQLNGKPDDWTLSVWHIYWQIGHCEEDFMVPGKSSDECPCEIKLDACIYGT